MDKQMIDLIQKDIKRCEDQPVAGSYALYQALTGKYNKIFPNFSDEIPKTLREENGRADDYTPLLNAIKEKLEICVLEEKTKDPLYQFKEMLSKDILSIESALDDSSPVNEHEKQNLYSSITAKYHPYIPKLGDGLYSYIEGNGFYDIVSGESLKHNLNQIYNKLIAFRSLNYPGLGEVMNTTASPSISITNTNQSSNTINVSFESVRERINDMTSLPEEEIEEIQQRVNELERIVNSSDGKSKKWSAAKEIIKWIAEKGVDVGITLLPLLLKIS